VLLDCFDADAQFRRHLFVGLAFGNQLEHLCLARTQANGILLEWSPPIRRLLITIVEAPGNGGAEESVSFVHFPNRQGQFLGGGLFEQKSRRARPECTVGFYPIAKNQPIAVVYT
jgi:hypothetical protein